MRQKLNGASTVPGSLREYRLSFLSNIFRPKADREQYVGLYQYVVSEARSPSWYLEGQVPDTLDGRFDMVAALLALVMLRLEREGDKGRSASARIAETFIDDMEGSVRQLGIGDLMVGKHVGKMMSALGGRIGAFRTAIAAGESFRPAVRRNIFHDAPPSPEAEALVAANLEAFTGKLAAREYEEIIEGRLS
jgi:cytochrome b pre-mRNA-processing protein 3